MASTLDSMPRDARIAIIRIRSLGDCVLTTPALQLLNQHRPDLTLGVVVEDRFRGIFEGHPAVGEILTPALPAVRRFRPEMVVNLHGGTRSTLMTLASGARIRAGFAHYTGIQAYNLRIPRAQQILGEERPVHTAEHLASAMFYLGVPRTEIPRASLHATGPSPEPGAYAVMHPFASAADKAWPSSRFVAVARNLGQPVVILAGSHDDITNFAQFRVYQSASLETVKRLLQGAALFIGNDSGPAHMAAAFGLPVVVLFGSSNSITWAPWKTQSRVLQSAEGLTAIPVDECLKAADELKVRV